MTPQNERAWEIAVDPCVLKSAFLAMVGLSNRDPRMFAEGASAMKKRLNEIEAEECEARWRFLCEMESP
mgnify:CR=1 FL=1|jgi:hypothetical protein